MTRPFVAHYDEIYVDKDYGKDIRDFLAMSGAGSASRVLEIGAGTGNQTLRLAAVTSSVTAVEIDADFATAAKRKLASVPNVEVHRGPLESLVGSDFDAAAAFFHVLNYVADLPAFAAAVAARLRPGAPFVADVWNVEAVALDPPRAETRVKPIPGGEVRQTIEPTLDLPNQRVRLHYDVTLVRGGDETRFTEDLDLLLWTRRDLEDAFTARGFRSVEFWDYRKFPAPARDTSWRLWLRAR